MPKLNRCKGCRRVRVVVVDRWGDERWCCPVCAGEELGKEVDPADQARTLQYELLARRNCDYSIELRAVLRSLNLFIALAEKFTNAHPEGKCRCYHCKVNPNAAGQAAYDLGSFLWTSRFCRDMIHGGYTPDADQEERRHRSAIADVPPIDYEVFAAN